MRSGSVVGRRRRGRAVGRLQNRLERLREAGLWERSERRATCGCPGLCDGFRAGQIA